MPRLDVSKNYIYRKNFNINKVMILMKLGDEYKLVPKLDENGCLILKRK